MKVGIAHHSQIQRKTSNDLFVMPKNPDPVLHPFEKAREYTRALNAAKLERMFSKPFIAELDGHKDGVYALAKNTKKLTEIASGSADGEIRVWNLATQKATWCLQNAHDGFIRSCTFSPLNENLITCGDDKLIKIWNPQQQQRNQPLAVMKSKDFTVGVDHHYTKDIFATCGSKIDIWDSQRSEPIYSMNWGVDSINTVRFNPTEVSILASCGTDRNITLYDIRTQTPLSKLVMSLKSNAIAWNPMESFNFVVASEDHNVYMFDMRKMKSALNVYKDHVSAVIDVDFAPTGQEIVTASYDKTLRIFPIQQGHSRDIYHTSRMQRLFGVRYSMDSKYIVSCSDDASLRLWKSNASDKLGPLAPRERASRKYNDQLKSRYGHMPEVKKVLKSRHVPKAVKSTQRLKKIVVDAESKRKDNLRRHSKPGIVPYQAERRKNIVTIQK
ncbi:hypothetical protein MIR68_010938 [Amoeboaphelidium protococcarum]|nr:hypothetical protein MIR68_010938 [Amoeboaphelidium protococcarum]